MGKPLSLLRLVHDGAITGRLLSLLRLVHEGLLREDHCHF